MRRILPPLVLAVLLVAGCSSDDDGDDNGSNLPPEVQDEVDKVEAGAAMAGEIFGSLVSRLPFIALPGTPPAEGISFQPDFGPGAPPNSYIFVMPLDIDDDGDLESTLNGHCVLSGDPSQVGPGFTGTIQVSGDTPAHTSEFTATLDFEALNDGARLSGSLAWEEFAMGHMVAMQIPAEDPLTARNAAGDPHPTANFCNLNLDGDIDVQLEGPEGGLAGTWNFASNRTAARLTDAVYTDAEGEQMAVPDTDRDLACGEGAIEDWAGTWDFNYGCLPPESGGSTVVITIKNSTTISILDGDDPYEATIVPGSARIVRGHFFDGEGNFRYREDFTWSLSENSDVFTQTSRYYYTQGPNEGMPGFCSARAIRLVTP